MLPPPRDSVINDTLIDEQLVNRQALILEIVQSQAPIQTVEDLQLHLNNPKSPINKLSVTAKERFVNSIVFTENGTGGFLHGPLLELSQGDIYRIAKLFGVQFELSILQPGTFDKGDKNTLTLLGCDGDQDCFSNGDDEVCVVLEAGGRECKPLPLASCFSGC